MKDYHFNILFNEQIASDTYTMVMRCEDAEFFRDLRPGQFIHVRTPDESLTLRRPISICDAVPENGTVSIVYAVKGKGTAVLAKMQPGEALSVVGPLGNGFPTEVEGDVFLLGGGMGIAPLLYTARELKKKPRNVTVFLGFRSKENVFLAKSFEAIGCEVRYFTDDGSFGEKGFAVNGMLDALKDETILSCGPAPMYRALLKGLPEGNPCYISLEERMGCGIGACLTCACHIKTADGVKALRVCADGPVFPAREVQF